MKRKHLLYILGLAALILVLGNSLEFHRLDEKLPFGRRERRDGSDGPWHLLKVVPVRLELGKEE